MSINPLSLHKNPEISALLTGKIHDKQVVSTDDEAFITIILDCKMFYLQYLIKELGLDKTSERSTFKKTNLNKDKIISNHRGIL